MTLVLIIIGTFTIASGFMNFVDWLQKGQKENRPTDRNSRPARCAKHITYES